MDLKITKHMDIIYVKLYYINIWNYVIYIIVIASVGAPHRSASGPGTLPGNNSRSQLPESVLFFFSKL